MSFLLYTYFKNDKELCMKINKLKVFKIVALACYKLAISLLAI